MTALAILVLGSGAREHAIVWRLVAEGHQVVAMPGNPGMAELAPCVPGPLDAATVQRVTRAQAFDLVVIGPEAPLVAGLADDLRNAGLAVFGPGAAGAQLEGSKVFAKTFFARHGIRTAPFEIVATEPELEPALARLAHHEGLVVKADGLAAGKGVVVCASVADARAAARAMLAARGRLVIEARIKGREVSVFALTDGETLRFFGSAEDHKTIFDADQGPNTGGMGAVSPAWCGEAYAERVCAELIVPTVAGLRHDELPYQGVLYAGVMVDEAGVPWLLEYNCRFGDPEAQALLMRLQSELGALLLACARQQLANARVVWHDAAAVTVVVAAEGYPATPVSGVAVPRPTNDRANPYVFHAGTGVTADGLVTSGGRVFAVTARSVDVAGARQLAYEEVARVAFPGCQFRRDIGLRALPGWADSEAAGL